MEPQTEQQIRDELSAWALKHMREDVLKGIDAKIEFSQQYDPDTGEPLGWDCYWVGGSMAAISDELMALLASDAHIGVQLRIKGLLLNILDHNELGNFWYVKRA
jgi:hypothetical protein